MFSPASPVREGTPVGPEGPSVYVSTARKVRFPSLSPFHLPSTKTKFQKLNSSLGFIVRVLDWFSGFLGSHRVQRGTTKDQVRNERLQFPLSLTLLRFSYLSLLVKMV